MQKGAKNRTILGICFQCNGSFAANGLMVQNQLWWGASYTLGHSKQRKFKLTGLSRFVLNVSVRSLLCSMTDCVPRLCT